MKRNPLRTWLPSVFAAIVAPLIAAWPQRARAADVFWDQGAATSAWATGGNWSPTDTAAAATGALPAAGDIAVFNVTSLTAAQTVDMGADRTLAGLRFNSTGTVLIQGGGTNRLLTLGTSGMTINSGAGAVTIGNAATNGQGVRISLNGNQTWTNNSSNDATIFNSLTGTGNLTYAGTGVFRITGFTEAGTTDLTSTYSGTTTISSGARVIAQGNSSFGANSAGTTIASGGTLDLGGTLGNAALNLGTEAFTVSGTGVGGLGAIVATGTAGQQNAIQGAVTLAADTTFGGTQRWDIRNGTLNGAGFNLTKIGANSIFLSGTGQMGTALNSMTVRQGEFVFETGALAPASKFTNGINLAPTSAVAASFRSWGNNVDHSANINMDSSFAGSTARVEVQNGITSHSGTITATGGDNRLDVDANQIMIVDGVLAGAGTFRKEDSGVLLVNNAANTHSGPFNVIAGTLGGSGTLASSSVNLSSGTTLSPGNASLGAGTLSINNTLTSTGTTTAVFNLGTASDLVNTGTLTQNGTTHIAVALGAGAATGTPYTLFNYTTLGGTAGFSGFRLSNTHVDGTLTNAAGQIQLTLNSVAPLAWSGASNGQWNVGTATNPALPNFSWAPAPGQKVEFLNHDNVRFDDTNTGATNIVVNGTVTPGTLVFDHSTLDYTVDIGAPGQTGGNIAGTTGLVKNGTGTLTLLGAPTFTGPVVVNGGTLQLGNDSRVGILNGGNTAGAAMTGVGPSITLAAGTTLGIAVGNNVDTNYGNNISGSGDIVLNATQQDTYFNYLADRGAARIFGDNSGFTGTWTVNDGNRLRLDSLTALGNASSLTIKDGGGLLPNISNFTSAIPLMIEGKGWAETTGSLGAVRLFSNSVLSGPVTLTGDTRITAYNSSGTLSGKISGAYDLEFGFNHINTSAGTLNGLNAANDYTGDTTVTRMIVNAATLADSGAASSFGAGSRLITDNANINLSGTGVMTSNRAIVTGTLGIGATNIGLTSTTGSLLLNGSISTTPVAGSNVLFPQQLNFQQTSTTGTGAGVAAGGTIILDLANPVVTGGTTVHRQTLTLKGNTNFTVGASGIGTGGAFNLGASTGTNTGDATLNLQDAAVLTVYGDLDIGNQGAVNNYTVNQSGTSVVNALRAGNIASTEAERAMRIGHWGGPTATYNLTAGTINVPNNSLWVSYDGGGIMNQSGGTVNVEGLRMVRTNATQPATYNLTGGTLNVGALGFAKGGAGTAVPQFNFDGGTYRATASHNISSNIAINIKNGGGTFDTNGFNVTSGSRLIAGGTGAFTKIGLGELVLPGGNQDYTGATNINAGALTLNGATSLITASSSVNVGARATLAGTGGVTAAGGVSVAPTGTISPGLFAGAGNGTLTASNVTLSASSMVDITPAAAGGDLLAVTGGLTGTGTFNVLPVGATPLPAATYTLATAGNTTGLTAIPGAFPHLADGSTPVLAVSPTSVTVALSAAADPMLWSGAGGANWDTTTVNQWNGLSGFNNAAAYFQGDIAQFDDTSSVGAITVQPSGVRPADVAFNNSTTAYTLTGGGIHGGTAVTKAGTATTILAGDNTYTGGTTISAGTLQIGNGGTTGLLGQGNTSIATGATLSFNRSADSIYSGVISGAGALRSDGSGKTVLNAVNTYSGGTTISLGTLEGNHDAFGSGTITLNDASTGAGNTALLIRNGSPVVNVPNNFVVNNNGTGTATIGSSEDVGFPTGLTFSGNFALNNPTRILGELDRTTYQGTFSGDIAKLGTLTIERSTGLEDFEIGRVVLEKTHTYTNSGTGVLNVDIRPYTTLELRNVTNAPVNTGGDQLPDTASVTLGNFSTLQTGASGSVNDGETIGDLISASNTSRVQSTGGTSADLTFGTANNTTFNGIVNGGTGTFGLIKQGTGTVTLGGIYDNPSGRLTVNDGKVVLAKDSSNGIHAVASNLVINNGGTVALGGTYIEYRDAEDTNRNNVTQTYPGAPANFVDQIYNDLDVQLNTGGTLDMAGKSEAIDGLTGTGGTVTNSVAGTVSVLYLGANGAAGTFPGLIQDGAGVVGLVKGGTGTSPAGIQILNGTANNTYSGLTEIRSGTLTIQHPGALGATTAGTIIQANRDQASAGVSLLNINITTASTPAAPNVVGEPLTLISELSNDMRAGITNAAESTQLTGGIVVQGDGISQINAGQAAGDNLQINGGITGSSNGTLFLRGTGEIQVNSVINAPSLILARTDAGTLILNASGHDYREAQFVAGTVRTDVVNALDTGALVRMGQTGNANTLNLNGFDQTVGAISTNAGVTDSFARTITSATAATLNINTAAATGGDYAFGGTLSGALTLQKSGPGAQVLAASVAGNSITYTGKTIVSGGTLRLGANDRIPDAAATNNVVVGDSAGTAFLDLNGYNETLNGLHGTASGTVHSNGGHLGGTANSVLTLKGTATPAVDATFAGTLKNDVDTGTSTLALTKSGTGTQVLSGTNTYTGATNVNGGTLVINGNHSTATGAVNVASGATLAGTGTLGSALTVANGGIFAPGNSPGTMTTSSSATFGATSVLNYEFNGADMTVGGGVNDLFTGITNLTLGGSLNVTETVTGSFLSANPGDMWRIMNYSGTLTGSLALGGTMPTLADPSWSYVIDTTTVNQVNLQVVPEASTAGLAGLTALLAFRRRRRAA